MNNTSLDSSRPLTDIELHHFSGGLVMLDEIGNYIANRPSLTREEILKTLADLYVLTLKRILVK